jgi:hypothetical protein
MENVKSLLTAAHFSHLFGGLFSLGLQPVSPEDAAGVSGLLVRTVQRAAEDHKRGAEHDHLLLQTAKRPHVKRVEDAEREAVLEWIRMKCPCRSGRKYHMQRCTSHTLYEEYRSAVQRGELLWCDRPCAPRSRNWFDQRKKEIKLRRPHRYWGNFECLLCMALPEELKKQHELKAQWAAEEKKAVEERDVNVQIDLQETQRRVTKLRDHEELKTTQAAYLHHIRHVATKQDKSRAMIVMDFSKFRSQARNLIPLSGFMI